MLNIKLNEFNCGVIMPCTNTSSVSTQCYLSVCIPSTLFFCSPQLDLFPDVQEAYVAELIQTNNVKDLNV